jgi:hypothetical protein
MMTQCTTSIALGALAATAAAQSFSYTAQTRAMIVEASAEEGGPIVFDDDSLFARDFGVFDATIQAMVTEGETIAQSACSQLSTLGETEISCQASAKSEIVTEIGSGSGYVENVCNVSFQVDETLGVTLAGSLSNKGGDYVESNVRMVGPDGNFFIVFINEGEESFVMDFELEPGDYAVVGEVLGEANENAPPLAAEFSFVLSIAEGCPGDFNADGNLDILDFVAFQNAFTDADPSADCNEDGMLNILDFVCFQNLFQQGCP